MNENPYQSPSAESQLAGIHNAAAGDLRRVGVYPGLFIPALQANEKHRVIPGVSWE